MEETTVSPLSTDEIHALFASDYVEVVVMPDGSIRAADGDDDSNVATRSLKRSRTWYAGV